jgi:hypothetical protein
MYFLFLSLAFFSLGFAFSLSSDFCCDCRIFKASSSSLLISSCYGKASHETILCSTDIIGFCPNMTFIGIYPVTVLWVVRSAHSANGSTRGLQDRSMSTLHFPVCFRIICHVSDNLTPILETNSLASLASNSPLSDTILPMHPYLQITSSRRNLDTDYVPLVLNARTSTWLVRSSLANTRYFICNRPIGIITMSTIHL